MGNSKTYLRILSFAGVLILSGALLLGLFQEARAADMEWTSVDESPSGTATYTFQLKLPAEEYVPIEDIGAVVEKDNPDWAGKRGATTESIATCPMSPAEGMDCTEGGSPPDRINVQHGESGVITGITLDRIFEEGSGSSLEDAGYAIACSSGAYTCQFDSSGYGYDGSGDYDDLGYTSSQFNDNGVGYGYGYETGRATSEEVTTGTGYGYDHGTIVFEFSITINANNLEDGTDYWISGIVETGSSTVGHFTTIDQEFTPSTGGGGGGGAFTGANTEPLGDPFDIDAGEWVTITGLPSGYDNLRLQFAQACDGCTVRMETHGTSPPSGTDALMANWRALEYFSIWVEDADGNELEGYIEEATLEFDVDADDLDDDDAQQVALTHNIDGEWEGEETRHTNDEDDDPLKFNATIRGFSVFAQAVDTEGPQFSNTQPTGTVQATTPSISADWEDNRGVDTDSFELTIDGRAADDTTGSLTVDDDGFTYTPGTAFDETQHEVEATVSDESGLSTTETWTFTVEEPECPEPPELTNPQPADGTTDVTFEDEVSISFAEGSCAIEAGELVVAGETVDTGLQDGELSGEIPASVEAGQQVDVTATVTDTAGNDAARQWSFTMSDEPGEPGGEDDGFPWVWVIVILVVIAIVGVGAYFYTEQE